MSALTKHQFFLLLEKQRLNCITEVEEKMLDTWFEQAPIIEELTFVSEKEKGKIKSDIGDTIDKQVFGDSINNPKRVKLRKRWFANAAAIIIFFLSFSMVYYLSYKRQPVDELVTITVPSGVEKMPVTLPDSSVVWLSSGSTIRFPAQFSNNLRTITLTGVGYFSVRPNKQAPFIVNTEKSVSARVLGTSFVVDVREEEKNVKISVITGRVQISEEQKTLDVLVPGESLSYSCEYKTFSKRKYLPGEVSEWQNNGLIFLHSVSLQELAVLLRAMYHVHLHFDNKLMYEYRFNMSFSKNMPIDELLHMLVTVSGLDFERADSIVNVVH